MAESGLGKIVLFNDFHNIRGLIGDTADTATQGLEPFFAGGEGFEDTDAGLIFLAGPNGTATMTAANTDADTSFIGTQISFDVGLQGTIVLETKVQFPDVDTKEVFFGLTSILSLDEQLEDIVINSSATALTLVADLVGFYFSDELTASATSFHGIHAGGSAADSSTVADVVLGQSTVVANEWMILRLEVDNNGDARWFVNSDLKQSVSGAASTTTDVAVCLAFAANTTELVVGDIDYLKIKCNRDWTI